MPKIKLFCKKKLENYHVLWHLVICVCGYVCVYISTYTHTWTQTWVSLTSLILQYSLGTDIYTFYHIFCIIWLPLPQSIRSLRNPHFFPQKVYIWEFFENKGWSIFNCFVLCVCLNRLLITYRIFQLTMWSDIRFPNCLSSHTAAVTVRSIISRIKPNNQSQDFLHARYAHLNRTTHNPWGLSLLLHITASSHSQKVVLGDMCLYIGS